MLPSMAVVTNMFSLYTGSILRSSVLPIVIAVSNIEIAKTRITLPPTRSNLYGGDSVSFGSELASYFSEGNSFSLVFTAVDHSIGE